MGVEETATQRHGMWLACEFWAATIVTLLLQFVSRCARADEETALVLQAKGDCTSGSLQFSWSIAGAPRNGCAPQLSAGKESPISFEANCVGGNLLARRKDARVVCMLFRSS